MPDPNQSENTVLFSPLVQSSLPSTTMSDSPQQEGSEGSNWRARGASKSATTSDRNFGSSGSRKSFHIAHTASRMVSTAYPTEITAQRRSCSRSHSYSKSRHSSPSRLPPPPPGSAIVPNPGLVPGQTQELDRKIQELQTIQTSQLTLEQSLGPPPLHKAVEFSQVSINTQDVTVLVENDDVESEGSSEDGEMFTDDFMDNKAALAHMLEGNQRALLITSDEDVRQIFDAVDNDESLFNFFPSNPNSCIHSRHTTPFGDKTPTAQQQKELDAFKELQEAMTKGPSTYTIIPPSFKGVSGYILDSKRSEMIPEIAKAINAQSEIINLSSCWLKFIMSHNAFQTGSIQDM